MVETPSEELTLEEVLRGVPEAPPKRPPRAYGAMAGFRPERGGPRGAGGPRHLLHPQLVPLAGCVHSNSYDRGGVAREGSLLIAFA